MLEWTGPAEIRGIPLQIKLVGPSLTLALIIVKPLTCSVRIGEPTALV